MARAAEKQIMAELQSSDDQEGRESSVVKVNPEDYETLGKDCTSVKVICLGDRQSENQSEFAQTLFNAQLFVAMAM